MPTSNLEMIRKLQIALNSKGYRILFNRSQFYSEEQKRPVTMYKVSQSVWDEEKNAIRHLELFTTFSQIQVVLFLRNLWHLINGKPIPPTNQIKGASEFTQKWEAFVDNNPDFRMTD